MYIYIYTVFDFDFMPEDVIIGCVNFTIVYKYDGFSIFQRKGKQRCKLFSFLKSKEMCPTSSRVWHNPIWKERPRNFIQFGVLYSTKIS